MSEEFKGKAPNSVYVRGNLGDDPFSRSLNSGALKVTFSIAINERYKNKAGEDKEETTWVDVECWDDTAQMVLDQFKKGAYVEVSGRLRKDVWEDKATNQKRSKHYIRAFEVKPAGRSQEEGGDGAPAAAADKKSARRSSPKPKREEPQPVAASTGGEEIPF
jgi:single-strand DNA-binding protein